MTEPPIDEPENEQDHTAIVTPEVVQPGGRLLAWGVAAVLICAFLAIDFFTPQLHHSHNAEGFEAMLIGLCIGQVNLIAVWASLAPGNIVLRISWSLLLTTAMWYGLILGARTPPHPHMTRADAILLIIILLAGVAILQIPLWIAKKVFRWRLTRRPGDADASLQEDRQFHLQHLMIAMFLISVALSPLHQILPPGRVDSLSFDTELCVLLPAVILCDIVVAIPCIWWAFVSTAALLWLVLAWLIYCVALTAVEFACLCAALGWPGGGGRDMEVAADFFLLNLAQCAAVLGTLLMIRAIGFRLVRSPAVR